MLSVGRERANDAKLASSVADRIVRDIGALGWPEGHVLGSEPELLERYGVSRAVFREAVRLVEHQHVARTRRGPGGGLVVTSLSVDSVIDAVTVYLFYVDADVDEVFETRLLLEEKVAELAPARLREADIGALRSLLAREKAGDVSDHRELHGLLAVITANPAIEFFVDVLNRVTSLYLSDPSVISESTFGQSVRAHVAIGEAVIAGDESVARRRMRRHLTAEADYLRTMSRTRIGLPRPAQGDKRGEGVAFRILGEVADGGWQVGSLIGSEPQLMERYGVSRAVLREAVRVLEHHQVARMRRGPGGGLFVSAPGMDATTEAVALHLDRRSIRPEQLFEVRTAVELAILDRAVKIAGDDDLAALESALDVERSASAKELRDIGHDLHAVLARIAGNRVLELLARVLLRLTRIHQALPPGMQLADSPIGDVTRVHELIVEAVTARDIDLARLRMRKHLAALSGWMA